MSKVMRELGFVVRVARLSPRSRREVGREMQTMIRRMWQLDYIAPWAWVLG